LEFLIGQWGHETIQRTYRWTLGGKFMEMKAVGQDGATELIAWHYLGVDPGTGKVTLWEFTAEGNGPILTQTESSARGELRLEGRFRVGTQSGPLRVTWKKEAGQLQEELEQLRDGKWQGFTLTFAPLPRGVQLWEPTLPDQPPKGSPLAPLEKLVGTWLVTGESEGTRYAVEYRFSWVMRGHFLRSEYSVTTGTQTELHAVSMIGYDPETKALMQWGFSADGAVITAIVRATADSVVTDGEMVSATRRTPVRVTYAKPDPDTLSTKTEMQRQGAWRSTGTGLLKRK
jgi:hypothetical protein